MALKKFIRLNSEKGYLEDKDDINYYATQLMRKVAFGGMLGNFDENGLYVIDEKIVEQLIAMPKVIVEIVDDSDLIRSMIKGDTFFHFILSIEDNKAIFKLLEKIPYQSNRDFNTGVYSDINEYVLDEVEIPDKDFNRNALYDKYNISTEVEGSALSLLDADEDTIALYYDLIKKLKTNYLVQNAIVLKEKEIEDIEADYFEDVLNLLAEYEDYGKEVKADLQQSLASNHNFVLISRPFFQQTVNEVLDSYIELHMGMLSPEQKEQFLIKMREIKAKYYEKFKQVLPMQINADAGVRLDSSQVLNRSIIGGLAQEVATKGYTASAVRNILINEDELQLSINKIKEILKDNQEQAKRDNAGAKEITEKRKNTKAFYKEIVDKQKTDLLAPNSTLIKTAINEQKTSEQIQGLSKVASNNPAPVKNTSPSPKKNAVKAGGGRSAKGGGGQTAKGNGGRTAKGGGGRTAGGNTAGAKTTNKQTKAPSDQLYGYFSYNDYYTGGKSRKPSKTTSQASTTASVQPAGTRGALLDELTQSDKRLANQASSNRPLATLATGDLHELNK